MHKLVETLERELKPVSHCADLVAIDKGTGHGTCKMRGKITVETCMDCRYRRAA